MKKLLFALALLLAPAAAVRAQNPVIRGAFTADPTARLFNGRIYLYPSHDIVSPVEPERRWFSMADYHVYSSDNLTDWTDHGVILTQERVPWGDPAGYAMWAPDCVCRDGRYYFYFPDAPAGGRGFAVGVAVGESPEGPFVPEAEPIKGVAGIDPCVLQASDGRAYLYWAGAGLWAAPLKANMTELDGEPVRVDEALPAGFKEGPFVFEREGRYYLTYPWVRDRTETLAYAMAESPLGPFAFKGLLMEQSPAECWTNHHSLVEYAGTWYLFYHHNDYSPDFDKNRSVRIDRVTFNDDGTILPVTPTLRGVGLTRASSPVQLDRYSAICPVAAGIDFLEPADPFAGWFVSLRRPGSWVRYDEVDFGASPPVSVRARVRSAAGGRLLLEAGEGKLQTEIGVPAGGWCEVEVPAGPNEAGGRCSVRATSVAGDIDIDWVCFVPADAPGGGAPKAR